jgi:hypothetical protein
VAAATAVIAIRSPPMTGTGDSISDGICTVCILEVVVDGPVLYLEYFSCKCLIAIFL